MDGRSINARARDAARADLGSVDLRRSEASELGVEERDVAQIPEDVAVLYSWANLHGAKYRDFSASRREYRAQKRSRGAEKIKEEAEAESSLEPQRMLKARAAAEVPRAQSSSGEDTRKAESEAPLAEAHPQQAQEDRQELEDSFRAAAAKTGADQPAQLADPVDADVGEEPLSGAFMVAAPGGESPVGDAHHGLRLTDMLSAIGGATADPYQESLRTAVEHHMHKPSSDAPLAAHFAGRVSGLRASSAEPPASASSAVPSQAEGRSAGSRPAEQRLVAADYAAGRIASESRMTEQQRRAEQERVSAQQRLAEQELMTEQNKIDEQQRIQEHQRAAEQRRVLEHRRMLEQQVAEQRRMVEQQLAGQRLDADVRLAGQGLLEERGPIAFQTGEPVRANLSRQAELAVPAGRPAWLYESEIAAAPARTSQAAPAPPLHPNSGLADTLQQSRERVASRWFALKGIFENADQQAEVQQVRQKEARTPVLALFSLAGGVGKTSMVATLGRALASLGEKTLLTDTTSYGLLPFYFGARELRPGAMRTFSPPNGSTDAPINLINVDVESKPVEAGNPGVSAGKDWLVEDIARNSRGNNRVVIDLATASGSLTRRILQLGPLVLVPVSPDLNSVISLAAAEQFFQNQTDAEGRPIKVHFLLNQFDASQPLHLDVREVLRQQLGDRLLPFVIRRSPAVSEALAEGMTVMDYAPNSPVADDYMSLAAWVRITSAPASLGFRGVRWSEQR